MMEEQITLDHGSGGKVSHAMVSDMILPHFTNKALDMLDDGARIRMNGTDIAFSTDTYVVDPIFFPGGNIGDLAVNGTVNDVAMCGADPMYISTGLIIEEGFPKKDLETILSTMAKAARKAGVDIVTGDTKVVPKGKADKIFINTAGIGLVRENVNISGNRAEPGDKIIISGTIADHGITVLTEREELGIQTGIQSDSAALNHMVKAILDSSCRVNVLRDPTRGGLGTTLNEIAAQSNAGIRIQEDHIPIKDSVIGVCELLGFDPLYIANEGKLIAVVKAEDADRVLDIMHQSEFGEKAAVIGDVTADNPGRVVMDTLIGGSRIVDMLTGEQLPRIC